MFRDTTLMYDPYAKRIPFFLNFYHSCHSEILPWCTSMIHVQRYYLDVQSVCKKSSVLPEWSSFLPFRDTALMYNPYAEILRWCTIRIKKEHRSSLLLGLSGVANILRYRRYSTRRVSIVVWPRNNFYLIFPAPERRKQWWLVYLGKKYLLLIKNNPLIT
jgi:hypothetical protein